MTPLRMALRNGSDTPILTPYFEDKELHMDSEILNTGLSAISVKGYDAGDPKEYIGLRARNSFRSIHRPDLSKLKNWTGNHARQKLGIFENDPGCSTLPINDDSGTELVEGNQLTYEHRFNFMIIAVWIRVLNDKMTYHGWEYRFTKVVEENCWNLQLFLHKIHIRGNSVITILQSLHFPDLLIHATVDETADMDDDDSTYISEPRTTQFSDNDLDENTNLHKCRAEFCVTIGRTDRNLRDGITGRIENIGMTPVQEELNEKTSTEI